jgi:hypothetical protein
MRDQMRDQLRDQEHDIHAMHASPLRFCDFDTVCGGFSL